MKHKDNFWLSNSSHLVDIDLPPSLIPPAPIQSFSQNYQNARNGRSVHYCSICRLEHSSGKELTQHCLTKEHARRYYSLKDSNPPCFAKLQKHKGAFECYICKVYGPDVRFSYQKDLQVFCSDEIHLSQLLC